MVIGKPQSGFLTQKAAQLLAQVYMPTNFREAHPQLGPYNDAPSQSTPSLFLGIFGHSE
jgi:hypothetical protein